MLQPMDHAPVPRRRAAFALMALVLASLLLTASAAAQVSYDLGGAVGAEFGVAVDGTIPVAAATFDLTLEGEVGQGFFPDAVFEATLQASYDAAAADPFTFRLGSAYAKLFLDDLDLTIGNQVVAWGSVDAVGPVDVVNPRDLTYPVRDPADQRLATPMIRATFHAPEGVTVDAVLVPVFVPSTLPGERWQPATVLPPLPPGMSIVGVAEPVVERPGAELGNVQFGVRATLDLDVAGGADASVVVYRGFRHTPTVSFELLPADPPGAFVVQPRLDYGRLTLLGGDFSLVLGSYVVRGEAAYGFGDDPSGTDPRVANDTLDAVLGVETNLPGGVFLALQGVYQHVAADAGMDADDTVSTILAARFDPGTRTGLQVGWVHAWSDGSGVFRPNLSYTFADGLTGSVEAAVFYGRVGSTYGAWRDNSQLRLGASFAF